MTDSKASELLALAEAETDRLQRHLLVAAALREALTDEPIVVGGTAEEFWTTAPYHETDLDLCATVGKEDRDLLRDLGFRKRGRHWEHEASGVAVEFPDSKIDGDYERTVEVPVAFSSARIIGLDDLYLDRLRQATMPEHEGVEFVSALAVVAARYDDLDWNYIQDRIEVIAAKEKLVSSMMERIDSRIRRRVRQKLSENSGREQ